MKDQGRVTPGTICLGMWMFAITFGLFVLMVAFIVAMRH